MDGSQTSTRDCFPLLSLADELLLCIIEHIDSREALINLAAASPRLQGLVEPSIWRSLLVRSGNHARTIVWACHSRPERVAMIQELSIRYQGDEEIGIEDIAVLIPLMRKLRHFTLETPCPNDGNGGSQGAEFFLHYSRIDYTRLFESAVAGEVPIQPLSMLQSGV